MVPSSRRSRRHPATRRNLAVLLAAHGKPAEGERLARLARAALATLAESQAADSWVIAYVEGVLGTCAGQQRYPEAEQLLRSSYHCLLRIRGRQSPYCPVA